MAVAIATGAAERCTLDQCLAALDQAGFDPQDGGSLAHAAHWLARLAANRDFLGDIALAELRQGCRRPGGQGYSPQVMMLGLPRPGWFLRANIWPSRQEAVLRTSGEAAFAYGLAHDHNFDFLTVGYHGPGYVSDHYEVDVERLVGFVGERVSLRPMGRATLSPGTVMHYRARRDVHCQHPPESLSVSINLMHSAPQQRWTDQFRYDLDTGSITHVLTGCTGDTLARMALALDRDHAHERLQAIAAEHPQSRLRWSAIRALALAETRSDARNRLLDHYGDTTDAWLARRCLAAISD